MIGTKTKSIDLITKINKILDSYNKTNVEIDLKYFDIDTFRIVRSNNAFLKSIEGDCVRLEDYLK